MSGQHRHDLKKHELCLGMEETELFVLGRCSILVGMRRREIKLSAW